MDLQTLINGQPSGGKVELSPGEFFGQIIVDRPITIVGKGKSTWIGSRSGPTIRVTAPGVKLQNLMVEVTSGPEDVAVEAAPGTEPLLENVIIKGVSAGISPENVTTHAKHNETDSTRISFLPPPPMSPGADLQGTTARSVSPVSGTTQPPPTTPKPRSRFSWLKFAAAATVLLCVVFAAIFYVQGEKTREIERLREAQKVASLGKEWKQAIAKLKEARRLRALEEQRIEREKLAREEELAKLKETERLKAVEKERLEKEEQEKEAARLKEIERLKALQKEREQKEKELPSFARNYPEEVKEELRRAIRGQPAAQANMGIRYREGKGVPKDDAEAVNWFQKAAEQGNPVAQYNLGLLYNHGYGVRIDRSAAESWFRKAAAQGCRPAQHLLTTGSFSGFAVSRDEVLGWYGNAAEQGDTDAQVWLGYCYAQGKGVPIDDSEALKWYRKAAESGSAEAQFHLGDRYQHGKGVAQSYAEAVKWYRKSAAQGDQWAKEQLRKMGVSQR